MEIIKHVISVNVAVIGAVEELGGAHFSKWNGNQCFASWQMEKSEVARILSYGNMGRKVLGEDIARGLQIGYTLAKDILNDIEKAM